MIIRYRTSSTMQNSLIRLPFVRLSRHAAELGSKIGMNPCVDRLGNNAQLLAQNWASGVTDVLSISLFDDVYGSDPISEQRRCWSHGNRLKLGRLRT